MDSSKSIDSIDSPVIKVSSFYKSNENSKKKVFSIFNFKTAAKAPTPPSTPENSVKAVTKSLINRGIDGKRSLKRKRLLSTTTDQDKKEQMILDFGQKLLGPQRCQTCGMLFCSVDTEDRQTHAKFHKRFVGALNFRGWQKENVLVENLDGSRIVQVMYNDRASMRKVQMVREVVDEELGFVTDGQSLNPHSRVFLYVSEKRIIAFCVAEIISQGYRMIAENGSTTDSSTAAVSLWRCSTEPEPVQCGINRIWVLRSERRKGIASALVDCVRTNFVFGRFLNKDEIAFSDPTPDGKRFAFSYIGNVFKVYGHGRLSNQPVSSK